MRKLVATMLTAVLVAALAYLLNAMLPDELDARSSVILGVLALAVVLAAIGVVEWWSNRRSRRDIRRSDDELAAFGQQLGERVLKIARDETSRLVQLSQTLTLEVEPRVRLFHDPLGNAPFPAAPESVPEAFEASVGRLVVVGEPGAGKSIAVYELACLLAETKVDPHAVPVVVNLSAWDNQETFERFLVDTLMSSAGWYEGIASDRELVAQWVAAKRYALLLDGLDEVPDGLRQTCMQRLEDWLPERMPIVLTCRIEEFDQLLRARDRPSVRLRAVELQRLTETQMADVIATLATNDPQWRQLARPSASGQRWAVRRALSRPLILNLALASRISMPELREAGRDGPELVAQVVVDLYLESQLRTRPVLRRWVTWIVAHQHGQEPRGTPPRAPRPTDPTVFELARLTPARVSLSLSLPLGLIVGLMVGLTVGLMLGLTVGPMVGLTFGLMAGLTFGLTVGLTVRDARSQRTYFHWPGWREVGIGLTVGLMVGLTFGLMAGLTVGLTVGLTAGLTAGLTVGLTGRWTVGNSLLGGELRSPWQRSRNSTLLSFVVGLAFGLAFGLPSGLAAGLTLGLPLGLVFGLPFGLAAGLVFGLDNGGWFLVEQWRLRRRLRRQAGLEGEPLDVLTEGVEIGLLRAVGSGVRFLHDEVAQALITRPVVTIEVNARKLQQGRFTIHETLLDGDENLRVGAKVLVYDGDLTYLSATVTAHEGEVWELTLQRDHG